MAFFINYFQKVKNFNFYLWGLKKYYFFSLRTMSLFLRSMKTEFLIFLGCNKLGRLFLSPSHQCNANCPHCYEKYPMKSYGGLSTDECKRIIDEFKDMGGYIVYFCSGEFLMRPDALALVDYCSKRKIATSITTNGLLINEDTIIKLKKAGLKILVFSVDSANEMKHDSLRGNGCLKKVKDGLALARRYNIEVQIWTYMTRSHSEELDGIAELAKKNGVEFVYVFSTILSGNLFNKFEENFSFAEREGIRHKYIRKRPIFLEFPEENWYCKGGGNNFLNIMPTGDVTFCPPVAYSYGNIKREGLGDILLRVRNDYKKMPNCVKGQCPINFPEYREKCNAKFIYSQEENSPERK